MPAADFTVLLPCGGEGRRFGAPYPKELHRISPSQSLIDLALAPVIDLCRQGLRVRLVVALTPDKLATATYLARYGDQLELALTFQRPRHGRELPGALRAAAALCAGPVVLLLPDQHFAWSSEDNPIRQALAYLADEAWVVIAALTTDPKVLAAEGAVFLDLDKKPIRAVLAADKPADPHPYNAVWAAVACGEGRAAQLPELVEGSESSPVCGAPAVLVDGYRNVSFPEQAHGRP
jgi:hypothetical protein